MRTSEPRIQPVDPKNCTEEQAALLKPYIRPDGWLPNIYGTLARHPVAMKPFTTWSGYVVRGENTLAPRERELVILRTGWLCRSGYEWTAHGIVGREAGLTDLEIERIKIGSAATEWTAEERALLRAAEQIFRDHFVADALWAELKSSLSEEQLMDLVYSCAQYTLISTILNTFGIQLDDGWAMSDSVRKSFL